MGRSEEGKRKHDLLVKDYHKKYFVEIHLKINKSRTELINHLAKQKNRNGYIVSLIKKDMEKR